jgi:protein regulator of cytokinesis 1
MQNSLDGTNAEYDSGQLTVTYPLKPCLQGLKEIHKSVSKLHRERYEQVKSTCCTPLGIW